MIYLVSGSAMDAVRVVLLEPGDMLQMMDGALLSSADHTVVVGYAPDPVWLARKVSTAAANDRLDRDTLAALLAECKERGAPGATIAKAPNEEKPV